MKKLFSVILVICISLSCALVSFADSATNNEAENNPDDSLVGADGVDLAPLAKGAYLVEASSGKVIFAKDEYSASSIASVTKVMTLLLVCEALDKGCYTLEDKVTVSSHAASMGGSQVFLEEGEVMTVRDLLKSTVIASANDAAVALAELTSGSEAAFVRRMNERARELGLRNTAFENVTGLDDTATRHFSCAADIGVMSRELIKHPVILEYSCLWQDSIREGEFTLTNTNRLVRYYDGCNGLKTGSTDKAGYCVSATAKRDNMQLIAVVLGAESRDDRNTTARELLDYGFANYALFEDPARTLEEVPVLSGTAYRVTVSSAGFITLVPRDALARIELVYHIPESLNAPVSAGGEVGEILYILDGQQLGRTAIVSDADVDKITLIDLYLRILKKIALGK